MSRLSPQEVADLISLPFSEIQKRYPNKDRNNIQTLRRYYIKKLKGNKVENEPALQNERINRVAELLERSGIDPENVQKVNRVNVYQGYMKNKEGEFETTDLYSVQYTPVPDQEAYTPIEPAKITPTKRKRAVRASSFILAYGDGQVDYRRIINPVTEESELVPIHSVEMHDILKQFNARYRPETTVNLGDFCDMASLSKFSPSDDHFHKTLGPSMRYIHDFYAQLVADNPDSHHVEVDSNHAVRIKKRVLESMPAMHDFVRPGDSYAMMTYYNLANLGKLGIDFISGYGAAEYVYGEDYGTPIIFKHGTHSSSASGATVRKEAQENPTVNVVRGHGHHHEEVRRTTRRGEQLFYLMLGSSCLNTGEVPGYHSAVDDHNRPVKTHQNHQNTFAMIEDFHNGQYNITPINVIDGKAYFQGEEFTA